MINCKLGKDSELKFKFALKVESVHMSLHIIKIDFTGCFEIDGGQDIKDKNLRYDVSWDWDDVILENFNDTCYYNIS